MYPVDKRGFYICEAVIGDTVMGAAEGDTAGKAEALCKVSMGALYPYTGKTYQYRTKFVSE